MREEEESDRAADPIDARACALLALAVVVDRVLVESVCSTSFRVMGQSPVIIACGMEGSGRLGAVL